MSMDNRDHMTLGGTEFLLTSSDYENEYNFMFEYESDHRLSNAEMRDAITDAASNHGDLKGIHVFYRDKNDPAAGDLNKHYEHVDDYERDEISDQYRCIRSWCDLMVGDKPICISLFNHMTEESEVQKAFLLYGCHDKTCGGTVDTIVYYVHDGEPVKRDTNKDAFFAWDEKKQEWVRSHSLWCDFFGWDGWGDGVGVFDEIDKEVLGKRFGIPV